ncbi:MAG: hypothetical protein PF508_16850 [Spirochaeta sp.]|jgi:hypothetical protein|nr:hypothetical protein [Spirochaeta sp.]
MKALCYGIITLLLVGCSTVTSGGNRTTIQAVPERRTVVYPDLRGDFISDSLIIYSIENEVNHTGVNNARLSIDLLYREDAFEDRRLVMSFRILWKGDAEIPEYTSILIEADGSLFEVPWLTTEIESVNPPFAVVQYGFQTDASQFLTLTEARSIRFQLEGSPSEGPYTLSAESVSAIDSFFRETVFPQE